MSTTTGQQSEKNSTHAYVGMPDVYLTLQVTDEKNEVSAVDVTNRITADVLWHYVAKAFKFHMHEPDRISASVNASDCSFTIYPGEKNERFYDLHCRDIFEFISVHFGITKNITEMIIRAKRTSPLF